MLTYHNDPEIKARYLARVAEHRRLDQILQSYGYWEHGSGCAVGCTIHGSSHLAYETELGIPESIARLEDVIFEGLPRNMAREWPGRFLMAVEPGQDLSRLQWRFFFWLLTDFDPTWSAHPIIGPAVQTCANLMHEMVINGACDPAAARAAEAAAKAAAKASAGTAAEAAAMAAVAAAWAAAWAARAAGAVAWAARGAAGDDGAAAMAAAFALMADTLIEMISDCPYAKPYGAPLGELVCQTNSFSL